MEIEYLEKNSKILGTYLSALIQILTCTKAHKHYNNIFFFFFLTRLNWCVQNIWYATVICWLFDKAIYMYPREKILR